MSKEDVITQLERTIQGKEKAIHELEQLLNEETGMSNRLHETVQHLKQDSEKANKHLSQQEHVVVELKAENKHIEEKYQEAKNEIDYLQEEIKTLEFKFAHSQKEVQDFKNLLDTFDMKLLNSRNALELKERVDQLENELNDVKNENVDLNAHIFALDEFMRDKEQQCDQLEDLNRDLANKLRSESNSNNCKFMDNLQMFLNSNDVCLNDLYALLVNLCFHLKRCTSSSSQKVSEYNLNDDKILDLFRKVVSYGRRRVTIKSLHCNLKSLGKLCAATDTTANINRQLITYMSEQLMHKAIINGQLKFVCDVLRQKQTSTGFCLTSSNSGSNLIKTKRNSLHIDSANDAADMDSMSRDENICKIASELLLYDEDSLRK